MEMFKKEDFRTGMMTKDSSGDIAIVMMNSCDDGKDILNYFDDGTLEISDFDKNLFYNDINIIEIRDIDSDICELLCSIKIDELWEESEIIWEYKEKTITQLEYDIMCACDVLGMPYIAKDHNGIVYSHKNNPIKDKDDRTWVAWESYEITGSKFNCLNFNDKKAGYIPDLKKLPIVG